MLDIKLFREEKDLHIIRASERARSKSDEIVDEIVHLDKEWTLRESELIELREQHKKDSRKHTKKVGKLTKDDEDAMIEDGRMKKGIVRRKEEEVKEAKLELINKLEKVGNVVHGLTEDAENNIPRTWGEKKVDPKLKDHVELMELLQIVKVAGGRVYYLGAGVRLIQAIMSYALAFLTEKGYTPLQIPFFRTQEPSGKQAKLEQPDEELYKVSPDVFEKYLNEQPLCGLHIGARFTQSDLPIRYAAIMKCSGELDPVEQFEKMEQLVISSPNEGDSMKVFAEMITHIEEFYQNMKLPHHLVAVVPGELSNSESVRYDLETYFPASASFREAASCSNCTDYQSRISEICFGQKADNQINQYVHLLNSTLTSTERTLWCILENYQTPEGVEIPEVLVPYMGDDETFLPFTLKKKRRKTKAKKSEETECVL